MIILIIIICELLLRLCVLLEQELAYNSINYKYISARSCSSVVYIIIYTKLEQQLAYNNYMQ